jgi:RNA polymerase sigma factor (TIGR02999 family)
LRKLAASKMAHEAPGQTLQPTALVHEAWLRLVGNGNHQWNGRAHFFGAAAEAMRRILIEKARRRTAQRHGGGLERVDISMLDIATANGDEQLFAVNEALDKFAAQNPDKAELVKLRYFVGMTIAEAAEALGLSEPAARRQWAYARAWLFREIKQKVI